MRIPSTGRYTEYGKTLPPSLVLLGPILFLFATYYFLRVFAYLPAAFAYHDPAKSYQIFLIMLVLFVIYLNYLLTVFWLTSGNRGAWGRIMRQSVLYMIIIVLNELGVQSLVGDPFSIGPVLMFALLVFTMALMCTKSIRDFYTPLYSGPLPLSKWLPYIAWIDPFSYKRMRMDRGPRDI